MNSSWNSTTGGETDYTFVCPECGESVTVNPSMRDALLDNGCVICGATVSPAAFTACS